MEEERKRISNSEDLHYYNASNYVKGKGGEKPSSGEDSPSSSSNANASHSSHNTIYSCVWKVLLNLSVDPYPEVAQLASCVVDDVNMHLLNNSFSENISNQYLQTNSTNVAGVSDLSAGQNSQASSSSSTITTTTTTTFAQSSGNIVNTLRRSRSIVDVLKNFANPSMTPLEVVNPSSSSQNRNRTSAILSNSFKNRNSSSGSLSHLTSLSPLTPKNADQNKLLNKKNQSSVFDASFNMSSMKNSLPKNDDMNDRNANGNPTSNNLRMEDSNIKTESMIPLKSVFFYWSCEYFTESQTKVPEPEDPGSIRFNERQYKHERLEKLINDTHPRYGLASNNRFDERVTSFSCDIGPINLLTFHEFEPWIAVANDKDIIR